MALWKRKPEKGLVWHTNRGSQYASESHRAILNEHHVVQSMSRKGNYWDNSVSELFSLVPFGYDLKTELTHHSQFRTREDGKQAIFEYIEVFYLCPAGIIENAFILPMTICHR
jgi:putative transposase